MVPSTAGRPAALRRVLVFVQATLLAVSLSLAPAAPAAAAGTFTFNPTADAYVSGAAKTTNFGTATTLQVGTSPTLHSYLMFNVQGLGGAPTSATLQLWAVSAGSGTSVKGTSTSWTETGLTYNNAPTLGSAVSTISGITAGRWVSFAVSSLVTGNGLVAFALTSASATPISFASREDAAHAPVLSITAPAGAPTVPAAPTAVTATAGNAQASVSWTAPASDGGSPITGYSVTSSPGLKTCTTSGTLSCTVSGLTNGTSYTFTVTATNAIGTGPASLPSNAVTPSAITPSLRRAPYLTDTTTSTATVNLATDTGSPPPVVRYGPSSGNCATPPNSATGVLVVSYAGTGGVTNYQFKVPLSGLSANTAYCYRVLQGTTDLVGSAITFKTARAPATSAQFSFAVIGDWGAGTADESNVLGQIAAANPAFLMTTGDNEQHTGTQANYGDLQGNGNVFGSAYLPRLGGGLPIFAAQGNHGFTSYAAFLANFPQDAIVDASGGRLVADTYANVGTLSAPTSYASAWYAFTWGNARFYVLEGAWADDTGAYQGDFQAHFNGPVAGCPICGAELTWLSNDLAANASVPLKFAFSHYPLYSDAGGTLARDSYLEGPGGLEGLLASHGVDIIVNGHAHIYERNLPQIAGTSMVSYVNGGGGDALSSLSTCSAFDAYAIGSGSSSCHAPAPTSDTQVHSFLLVTVNGNQVTVTPTDETGRTFDVQTYSFGSPPPPTTGSIAGTVTDASSHAAISGATVTAGSASTSTAANGTYRIDGLAPATYTVTAAKTGYTSASGSAIVTAGTTQTVDIALTAVPPPPTTGSIAGTVTDASTGLGIAGATVGDGTTMTTTGTGGAYRLDGLAPGSHTVTASTPNYSPTTATASVTAGATTTLNLALAPIAPPPHTMVFSDGFESGNQSNWTTYGGLGVEGTYRHTGVYGAQGSTTAGRTYAKKQFASTYTDGYARSWFDLISASGNVNVLRLRTAADASLGYVTVTSTGHLTFHSDVSGSTTAASAATVSKGMWHELELHAVIAGSSGQIEVWLDGAPVPELTTTVNLGTTPIGKVQIGEVNGTGTWNVVWDDVAFDTQRIG